MAIKFIAQITGQRIILADCTEYISDGRIFDVDERHAAEVAALGFIRSEASAAKVAAPVAPVSPEVAPDAEVHHESDMSEAKPKRPYNRKNA